MKKKKESAFTIAFLDVLSNALAAVLILTIVRLQPSVAGDPQRGAYFIGASSEDGSSENKRDSTLVIFTKFTELKNMTHEPSEYTQSKARMNYYPNSVRIDFMMPPKTLDIEEIIIYSKDPDFSKLEGQRILVSVNLPQKKTNFQIALNPENDYRFSLFKFNKFNSPNK